MQGQGVVDLHGEAHNNGKGTLEALMSDPAKGDRFRHLKDEAGGWRVRDDVQVWFQSGEGSLRSGPLTIGYTAYEGRHHFGPELQFGHVIGDALENDMLLIKTAWGGKSLYADFRPPSSDGPTGPCYTLMIEEIQEALVNIHQSVPGSKTAGYEIAGFVWYHGWNDGCDPEHAVPEYEANLVNLIRDVRNDLASPDLPVVIGELTGPWVEAPDEWDRLRKAQAAAVTRDEWKGRVLFVPTAAARTRCEWVYVYVAVEPQTGFSSTLLAPKVDTGTFNQLLRVLSKDVVRSTTSRARVARATLAACSGVTWHHVEDRLPPRRGD